MGFEIVEQLGWRFPKHLVSPVAGGTLLPRILRGFRELSEIGLVDGELPRIHAAQAAGCAPVVNALRAGPRRSGAGAGRTRSPSRSRSAIRPTATRCCERVRATGGTGAAVDRRARSSTRFSCSRETEGIFTEPAGGTTLAGTIDLIERGASRATSRSWSAITGNGYKTVEAVRATVARARSSSTPVFRNSTRLYGTLALQARTAAVRP